MYSHHCYPIRGYLSLPPPCSVPAGVQRLMLGVFFSLLYALLNQFYPISYLKTQEFAVSHYNIATYVCCWHLL